MFRHYWALVKFLPTLVSTLVLLMHMRAVSRTAGLAAEATVSGADFRMLRLQLVIHAVGGLLVLLTATVLSASARLLAESMARTKGATLLLDRSITV